MKKFPPINPAFPHFLHGGDYNPDQWIDTPEIWDEDMRLMKLAGCNAMSIGIFSWATLEPEEGKFDFSFLDTIMDKLAQNDAKAVLATPSGARPAWLSQKYPEVLRVDKNRLRHLHGHRHNHCFTSPVYREKTANINRLLAQRYQNHPALLIWHISNEYGGECHCEYCQEAFREWLKKKYDNDLDKLNFQWWARFWSHTYTSWEQIEAPSLIGETAVHGHNLDWKRFVTHQTMDFMKNEITPLKELTPHIPVTTNFMGTYTGLDYHKLKEVVDVVSWDNYPRWHSQTDDIGLASDNAFIHDLNRSLKDGQPFMLMECTPSHVNWHPVNKLKRPGMHILSSMQAVAHGSDTVQYFQWRKSRGSSEKFHGAVVDHVGHEHTRVFGEVAKLGGMLKQLDDVIGTYTPSEVAIIYDWENRWAIDDMQGLQRENKKYEETCKKHYYPFWKNSVNVDVIEENQDFSKYKLLIAPMLYMIKPDVEQKIKDYVANGGTIVATYQTGLVNENDLCFLGGFPANELKNVFGIWAEEVDTLYETDTNFVTCIADKTGLGTYQAVDYCELIHANEAEVLATYQSDFYEGMPALTKNKYGKGNAYYIAFRDTGDFTVEFYESLMKRLGITKALPDLPYGVTAQTREDSEHQFIFVQNYNASKDCINLPNRMLTDAFTGELVQDRLTLDGYGVMVLKGSIAK